MGVCRRLREKPARGFSIGYALDAERKRGEAAAELEFIFLRVDGGFGLIEDAKEFCDHLLAAPVKVG